MDLLFTFEYNEFKKKNGKNKMMLGMEQISAALTFKEKKKFIHIHKSLLLQFLKHQMFLLTSADKKNVFLQMSF